MSFINTIFEPIDSCLFKARCPSGNFTTSNMIKLNQSLQMGLYSRMHGIKLIKNNSSCMPKWPDIFICIAAWLTWRSLSSSCFSSHHFLNSESSRIGGALSQNKSSRCSRLTMYGKLSFFLNRAHRETAAIVIVLCLHVAAC